MTATRVVLVAPMVSEGDRVLSATLAAIEAYGWTLVGLVAPEHHLAALRMVVDGEADAVLAARPEDIESVKFTVDLPCSIEHTGPRNERTRMLRSSSNPRLRRPGAVA